MNQIVRTPRRIELAAAMDPCTCIYQLAWPQLASPIELDLLGPRLHLDVICVSGLSAKDKVPFQKSNFCIT